jgi:RNA polymerase sigma factor (TIGR02999 family)
MNIVERNHGDSVRSSGEEWPGTVATDEIFESVYDELKRVARRNLRSASSKATLSTTELVHEAFLKLRSSKSFSSPAHFFGAAAHAMRQVLTDFARQKRAEKRGGGWHRVTLSDGDGALAVQLDEMLALDAALDRLTELDPRLARVVELRFFGGLPEREIASILGVTKRTVERDWLKARLFLMDTLERPSSA